ncbi:nitroreductase/quinone reductase family protein [Streptomyces atroolivaceus]|uniref:nitroreductase/quinone reductase family protein n=1 Tax=Streptomyces atroolivaceus TaxID=66869 RepID=UPI00378B3425
MAGGDRGLGLDLDGAGQDRVDAGSVRAQFTSSGLFFGEDEGRYVLVASGSAITHTHPQWYLNLTANPDVHLQLRAERFAARARTADGQERERLWALMAGLAPMYRGYEAQSRRSIPVVVLDRVRPGPTGTDPGDVRPGNITDA